MNTKPTILIFIDWFWPGYLAGGPVQSILSMVKGLSTETHFKIVTTNRDLNSNVPYKNIEANKWIRSELNCDIYYVDSTILSEAIIENIIATIQFDKVYINSFFSRYFSIVPLKILNKRYKTKPVIFAPRGMLGGGALAIKKFKKNLFILYSKITSLHANVTWHATSEQEEAEIKKVFGKNAIVRVISNLPKTIGTHHKKEKAPNSLTACFVSRISEKKNLDMAISLLKEVSSVQLIYNIYGPIEDRTYWEKCQKIISSLPSNVRVNYRGSINPEAIGKAFSKEHVMLLPTLNENFGHSIVESLLCGCPVIISDQTPWNDLEEHNAGFAIPLNKPEKFVKAIEYYAKMDQEAFSKASEAAIKYISNRIDLEKIKEQYKTLFNEGIKN